MVYKINKKKILSSKLFWTFRHFVHPSWIQSYADNKKPFLINYVLKNKIISVLDFGCAGASFLYNLKSKNYNFKCYGIDISSEVVHFCNKRFNKLPCNKNSYFFETKMNKNNIELFLKSNNLKKFQLVVFDRVLYCLNKNEINYVLSNILPRTEKVYIDDFQITKKKISKYDVYKHRNWIEILDKFNFECIYNKDSVVGQVQGLILKH